MQHSIIYPGTFDPITRGHEDLVARCCEIFDQVIVAVAHSTSKNTLFNTEERIELASRALADRGLKVEVCSFDGLLIDFVRKRNSRLILRGLRAVSDYEYELQLAGLNRRLANEINTLFLTPAEEYSNISSSLVREIARLGGDVSGLVSDSVLAALNQRYHGE